MQQWNAREVVDFLKSAASVGYGAASFEDGLAAALRLVCDFTRWPLGHAYLVRDGLVDTQLWCNGDEERFRPFVIATRETYIAPGEGLPGRILESVSPKWITDVRDDPTFVRSAAAAACGLAAALGFPIVGRRGVTAILEFYTELALEPDDALLDLLSHIGSQLGAAIDRAEDVRELESSRTRLAEAQRLARVGSWRYRTEPDLLEWSPELCEIYGFDEGKAPGSFADYLSRVHPADLDRVRKAIERTLSTHEPFEHEYRLVLPSGAIKWGHAKGAVTSSIGAPLELSGYCQDVTERRVGEDIVRSSEARLAEAQRIAHIGSWTWAVPENVVTWSEELYRIYGRDPNMPVTRETYLEHVHDEDRARVGTAIGNTLQNREPFEHDYRIVRGDGEVRWMHARGEVVESAGDSPTRLAGYCHDVTEARRAAGALRDIEEMKRALLVAVSHQIRTPLTVISGIAHTLERPDVKDKELIGSLASRLRLNADRLHALLGSLLDFDRLSRGVVEPQRHATPLYRLLNRVVSDLRSDRPIELDVQDTVAMLDAGLVERMIEHLLANALRFTPAGTPLCVRASRVDAGILFSVDDRGPGVPDAQKESIFDPFTEGGQVPHAPGTGIGLAFVARIAALHGGRAWVEDNPGGGASFRVLVSETPPPA